MLWLFVPAAKFKLATLVQYVPLPVVGGYLGYVGYFCLAAGIGLGCNTTINTFSSWANLFAHGEGDCAAECTHRSCGDLLGGCNAEFGHGGNSDA
jgi:hypothetical protein